jgi:hypothetical protein
VSINDRDEPANPAVRAKLKLLPLFVGGEPGPRDIEHSILTFTGRRFWPLQPVAGDVAIVDIAHALANLCRYTGHVRKFYSVAQHSVLVSRIVPPEYALEGLLHDASEAYLADIASPVKRQLPWYKEHEVRLEGVIAYALGTRYPNPKAVKEADVVLYATERRDLMPPSTEGGWPQGVVPLDEVIDPWPPSLAEAVFLDRYHYLASASCRSLLNCPA